MYHPSPLVDLSIVLSTRAPNSLIEPSYEVFGREKCPQTWVGKKFKKKGKKLPPFDPPPNTGKNDPPSPQPLAPPPDL